MTKEYLAILEEELVVAIGCTEPIAVAYTAAKASEVLESKPEKIVIKCSGNIIKNAKSVEIPNGNGLKGILACVALGFIVKGSEKQLEILESVTQEQVEQAKALLNQDIITLERLDTKEKLHIIVECTNGIDEVIVELKHTHNNISKVIRNNEVIFEENITDEALNEHTVDRKMMTVEGICKFVEEVDIEQLESIFDQVITHNPEIAQTGLKQQYGNEVARTISKYYGEENIYLKLKAMGSAGSDARMGGCPYPVVTVVGSGNQGMACSLPIIEYAKHKGASKEETYRALAMGLLMSIHQKTGIGRLSAYCGAVSASTGAACGMSYLEKGADREVISNTVTNALSIASGIICDGAKPSCAAKIATSLDAAILGHLMALEGNVFEVGTGLVKEDVEKTIAAVGTLARVGMEKTDEVILDLMLEN